jgi:hypothetical protein
MASNSFGVVEGLQGTFIILIRPEIVVQPVSQSVVAGSNVVLSITASGHPLPLSYRWRKNGIGLTNILLYDTNCFFTITNVQPNAGTNTVNYNVVVTNLAGAAPASSNAVLTVLSDSDGDGLPDEWELANSLSPTNSDDGSLDDDDDKATNGEEYIAGTDPRDGQSYLKLQSITIASLSQPALLGFLARAGKTYSVWRRDVVDQGRWISVADVPATSSNRVVEVSDSTPLAAGQTERFYRLVTPRSAP